MRRGGPLPKKRARPRRDEGRVAHGRIKRKATDKSAEEAAHLERVAGLPCCVTGRRPVVVHHLMKAPGKRCRRDHRWVVPLSGMLHNLSGYSVHALGSEEKFERLWELAPGYLIETARRLWEESVANQSV
jgi:hypothetical protein